MPKTRPARVQQTAKVFLPCQLEDEVVFLATHPGGRVPGPPPEMIIPSDKLPGVSQSVCP
jgi:hypothetical protein